MGWCPEEATDSGRSGIRRKTFACHLEAKYFYMLTHNCNIGTSKICYCTKRNLQPKKGIWLIQGHTAKVNIHWAACSVPGEGRALVSSASPTPFLLTASPFSTSQFCCLEWGATLTEEGWPHSRQSRWRRRNKSPELLRSGAKVELPEAEGSVGNVSLVTSATSLFSTAGLGLTMGRVARYGVGCGDTG